MKRGHAGHRYALTGAVAIMVLAALPAAQACIVLRPETQTLLWPYGDDVLVRDRATIVSVPLDGSPATWVGEPGWGQGMVAEPIGRYVAFQQVTMNEVCGGSLYPPEPPMVAARVDPMAGSQVFALDGFIPVAATSNGLIGANATGIWRISWSGELLEPLVQGWPAGEAAAYVDGVAAASPDGSRIALIEPRIAGGGALLQATFEGISVTSWHSPAWSLPVAATYASDGTLGVLLVGEDQWRLVTHLYTGHDPQRILTRGPLPNGTGPASVAAFGDSWVVAINGAAIHVEASGRKHPFPLRNVTAVATEFDGARLAVWSTSATGPQRLDHLAILDTALMVTANLTSPPGGWSANAPPPPEVETLPSPDASERPAPAGALLVLVAVALAMRARGKP